MGAGGREVGEMHAEHLRALNAHLLRKYVVVIRIAGHRRYLIRANDLPTVGPLADAAPFEHTGQSTIMSP